MDDIEFISLKCIDCENIICDLSKKYIPQESFEGCTRKVSSNDTAKYYHLTEEVSPFIYKNTSKEYQSRTYKEIIEFLEYIYTCPLGQKLNKYGKIKTI